LTIDQLQAQNGADAIVARQYNLNFPNMAPGSNGGAFPSATPASGFVGGSNGNATGVAGVPSSGGGIVRGGKGAAIGAAANNSRSVVPGQRTAVNARSAVATTAPVAGQKPVSNAALRTSVAATAKPAAAVKPVPAKPAVKKTADSTTPSK